ncbi:hypothetical protein GCM10023231_12660 [Olivibacter ginsenosidimutans]|uniref:Uncharacterized protein n=1 Tax=Olivibacter ginsenosidimutans TaxID=1176537 RepID=A0ABP9ATZ8_9SPHI
MDTLTIKIRNKNALKLLQDLEQLKLIQIVSEPKQVSKKKISETLAGSIGKKEAAIYHRAIKTMRDEWERNSY